MRRARGAATLRGVGVAVVSFGFVLVARACATTSTDYGAVAVAPESVDAQRAAEHLAQAVRIRTVSAGDGAVDATPWRELAALLASAYPNVHAELDREAVGNGSLVYRWSGTDASLRPLLLLAHSDVVPVVEASLAAWTHPPFAGVIDGGFVWGRGTLDDKGGLVAILEAAESLIATGFRPARTVYLAFGHDEEIGGAAGARAMAAAFAERGLRFEFVLDEGQAITTGIFPGLTAPLASIGVAEKGYLTVELSVAAAGGHSSTPPAATAIGILAAAVAALEGHPLPASLDGTARRMLEATAPGVGAPMRLALANLWLFGPLVERQMLGDAVAATLLRTTTAPTVFTAGVKDNVLPTEATAKVNFRVHPRDSVATVLEHVARTVDDPRVSIRAVGTPVEPSPVSSADSAAYRTIARTVLETHPGVVVSPGLVVAGTDSRHYRSVAEDVYRFRPYVLAADDVARIHGTDERIAVDVLAGCVRFYRRLLVNAAGS